jgi:CheY-like chemotaxis protein
MRKKVLVCDDDHDILSICKYILEDFGMEVYTRDNCNNIIDVVKDVNPDIILMDNWIPDTGGIIATQILKTHPDYNKIPVIYFSANINVENLAKKAGADYYLSKPFNISDLEGIITDAKVC